MIEVEHLHKSFNGTIAVRDISFEVNKGENLILLGTSGCGKTTTLRMLNRLILPTSGNIRINGQDVRSAQPEKLRRGIGYVMQQTGLFPHYTVAENIAIVPKLEKWPKEKIAERTRTLMQKLGLSYEEQAHMFPHELSGGQQQRVGIARALAADPPILLMDEPFGALDPITRQKIRNDFKEVDELKRKTIVMVTHDVQDAFALASRICLMDKGSIVQLGTPEELREQPVNDFVSRFLKGEYN
ncbi:ABC transporter ATP-binding protein [Chitinophaga cymbidii]|uniref:ABC transporter ATP-binding protein n=1 Tax=Chitinophaga cymbidii TaxID=1096750 RepID=A0A512RLR8_9BACT|nr:ABC transporter ATP-binding protein [Chitinophaga cymbidii]GEP96645.1 ABC transporter ATP-binding protein [Chitinophaga cymbidii]